MITAEQPIENSEPGYVGRIPVRNLWLLMLYASDLFRESKLGLVELENQPDELPDLVAEILCNAVEKRQRRQLNFGYETREANINRVRGKIDLLKTHGHQLLSRGLVACRFEELTINTVKNRFVKAALESISKIVKRKKLSHRCRFIANGMRAMGVTGIIPNQVEIASIKFGRNDSEDRFMINAAKLAFDLQLPTEDEGDKLLILPSKEIAWVRRLFERAVGGFYDVVLTPEGWQVEPGKQLDWQIEDRTQGIDNILPTMRTDIILSNHKHQKKIVIDTKFTSLLSKGWYREETLRSGYIYQIYTYLRSQVGYKNDSLAENASGLLLHPSMGTTIDESVQIQGHIIRFATVDLTASASEIRAQLIRYSEN